MKMSIDYPVLGNLQHQPLKVVSLSNKRCVMLCGRELRIYDIKTGDELLKLKGMMNQKLPLFGLHGDSHVVRSFSFGKSLFPDDYLCHVNDFSGASSFHLFRS